MALYKFDFNFNLTHSTSKKARECVLLDVVYGLFGPIITQLPSHSAQQHTIY